MALRAGRFRMFRTCHPAPPAKWWLMNSGRQLWFMTHTDYTPLLNRSACARAFDAVVRHHTGHGKLMPLKPPAWSGGLQRIR
mmetsp:Transcript_39649/g.109175  ORF Transcript_39649/g.109175 Transcript_39649/m.109175 type:complete len:82 (-) Transcript_39649:143-388(-)